MEPAGSFHSQLLAVVEVLAKAAVEEIHRRVDDSCAVLRLELSRSRRDIELLRRKWDMMEAELRRSRSRMRTRRRVFYPPERHTPSVLHKDTQLSPAWSSQEDMEAADTPAQCEDTDAAAEDEVPQIKVECPGDDVWPNEQDDKLNSGADFGASHPVHANVFVDSYHPVENPVNPVNPVLTVQSYDTFPDQQLNLNQSKLVLKQEELDEDAALQCKTEAEGEGHLWTGRPPGDTGFEQYEHTPADASASQSGPEDPGPQIQSTGSPRVKRRTRPFGLKRSQPHETHGPLSPSITVNQSSAPQNTGLPHCRTPTDAPCSLTRMRIRTPWRSGAGGGEKRFSCTYCGKRFMRFSQMTEHLRSHTGEKPFSCQQCGKAFTKQFNLIRHAVVHSGEKPFGCSLCGKCFTQRSSLKSHLKTAH